MALKICPFCDIAMEVKVREHVMIDVCPSCRGVWLDRGELEKIIADVRTEERDEPAHSVVYEPIDRERGRKDSAPRNVEERITKEKKKKKRSSFFDLLEDVLDFD